MRLQLEISALLVATALAVAVPSIVAPSAALADRAAAYSTSALKQTNDEPQTCELEHEGRDWRRWEGCKRTEAGGRLRPQGRNDWHPDHRVGWVGQPYRRPLPQRWVRAGGAAGLGGGGRRR